MLEICVGSINPLKFEAVKEGFGKYFSNFNVTKIKADSNVPAQPVGMELILKGALNRANEALNYLIKVKNLKHDILGVGIEAGLVKIPLVRTGYMDFQFCIIIDEHETITIGNGIGFEYPPIVINKVLSDKTTEIGEIMGDLFGNKNLKYEQGAIGVLSKYVLNRKTILTQAVICALLPRINKELYKENLHL
ncbi:MAG: inosine/xanthosine triphosphatase [Promethearchaeota archaeon]